jgi:hypothetical protein
MVQEILFLLSIPNMWEFICKGENTSVSEFDEKLDW